MKKFLSILTLMLLAFPALLMAQSDSVAVENSGYDALQRGTVRVLSKISHVEVLIQDLACGMMLTNRCSF